jgi:hypothetical protein
MAELVSSEVDPTYSKKGGDDQSFSDICRGFNENYARYQKAQIIVTAQAGVYLGLFGRIRGQTIPNRHP